MADQTHQHFYYGTLNEEVLMINGCRSLLQTYFGVDNWSRWHNVKENSEINNTQAFVAWILDVAESELHQIANCGNEITELTETNNRDDEEIEISTQQQEPTDTYIDHHMSDECDEVNRDEDVDQSGDVDESVNLSNDARRRSERLSPIHIECQLLSPIDTDCQFNTDDTRSSYRESVSVPKKKRGRPRRVMTAVSPASLLNIPTMRVESDDNIKTYKKTTFSYVCNVCKMKLHDVPTLKEHFDTSHPRTVFMKSCGCSNNMFTSIRHRHQSSDGEKIWPYSFNGKPSQGVK